MIACGFTVVQPLPSNYVAVMLFFLCLVGFGFVVWTSHCENGEADGASRILLVGLE